MSDAIIKVEGLGKKYIISHEQTGGYTALRDIISNKAKGLAQRKKIALPAKEEFWALKDVNFEIKQGEAVGIIGRNGAGKSTLLKILSRITEPTTGRIELNGRVASLLEVGTGFHPELTGRENIFLNGAILGMSRSEIRSKYDEIVDFSGVEKFLDTPVKRYSSGMYVRLAFAVAAHLEPEILVVDEVLAVGDAEFQKKCLGKMDEVSHKEGRTVLFVSHNMGMILKLCNQCILLNSGKVEKIGLPSEVIEIYHNSSSVSFVGKENSSKDIFLKKVDTVNDNNDITNTFAHSENIRLRVSIGINQFQSFQNIGVCLLTRSKNKVFTVNKALSSFTTGSDKEIAVDFIIEKNLIAPMDYSFVVALNTMTGTITYEFNTDICPIRVYDDGTDLAWAEGMDYGCLILKDKWELVKTNPGN